MSKKALILGINGQDGSYLAEVLLEKGYQVFGFYRRSSVDNLWRIRHLLDRITLYQGDLTDSTSLSRAIVATSPDEIYNEADQDHIGWSYATPKSSIEITASTVADLLEIVRLYDDRIKVFIPVSATIFGDAPPPQNENTSFNPYSPYSCAKVAAYYLARYYRQAFGMFVSTAIFFNHDSPRRKNEGYLLQDIVDGALKVKREEAKELLLGSLDMQVDIGFAREYMEAAYSIMQLSLPNDFVIGTGKGVPIRQLAEHVLQLLNVEDTDRIGINPKYSRPGVKPDLIADIGRAKKTFGFSPTYNAFNVLAMLLETRSQA